MQHNQDFKVTKCLKSEISDVAAFLKLMETSGASFLPQNEQYLLNKYRSYEKNDRHLSLFLLKNSQGIIKGVSGYVPFKGLFRGKPLNGFVGTDAIISPEERKKIPTLAMVLAHSYEQLVRRDRLLPLVCPADKTVSEYFKKVRWGEFSHAYKFFHPLAAQFSPVLKKGGIEIRKIDIFEKDIDVFFKRIAPQHDFLLHADRNFLNWKYFKNPYGRYVVLAAYQDKDVVGYFVAEKIENDICVVDITVNLEYPRVILLLLFGSLDYFEKNMVTRIVCCLSHGRYMEILRKVGFLNCWDTEFLFFKVGLLFSSISQDDFYSTNKKCYHLNGFAQHLY
ncbi:MAG: hypothetical protein WCI77_01720 [Candidatus Omnitrophota bacterium]